MALKKCSWEGGKLGEKIAAIFQAEEKEEGRGERGGVEGNTGSEEVG